MSSIEEVSLHGVSVNFRRCQKLLNILINIFSTSFCRSASIMELCHCSWTRLISLPGWGQNLFPSMRVSTVTSASLSTVGWKPSPCPCPAFLERPAWSLSFGARPKKPWEGASLTWDGPLSKFLTLTCKLCVYSIK